MTKKVVSLIAAALIGLLPTRSWADPSVTVVNPSTNPAIIEDNDNPARHPFQAHCNGASNNAAVTCDIPIPAKEEVVIETVSALTDAAPSNTVAVFSIRTIAAGTPGDFFQNPMQDSGLAQPNESVFYIGQSLHVYADPGTNITCETATRVASTAQPLGLLCSVSGHYVPLP